MTTDGLHGTVDDHLQRLLASHGAHEERSRQLLPLAANSRAKILLEAVWRHYGGVVAAGPFAGMRLLDQASEGCLLPKLLGCYETPLAEHLIALAGGGIDCVLNIGCAEGYYAVGLARLIPQARIYAFDVDPQARDLCRRLAALNGVSDRVEIGACFTAADFQRFAGRRALVVCDIEGGELDLLDPAQAPALAGFSLIVELHDRPNRPVSPVLTERFAATHRAVRLTNRERPIHMPEVFENWREIDQLLAVWEMRGGPTPWAVFTPLPTRLDLIRQQLPASLDKELLTALLLAERAWRLEPCEEHWQQLWDIGNRAGSDIEACRRFVDEAPDQPFRRITLGNAYRRQHRGSAAEAAYRHAMTGEPDLDAIVLSRLAVLLLAQDRSNDADELYLQAVARHPGRESVMRYAPSFFDLLQSQPSPEAPADLPHQPAGEGLVIFVACDGAYFDRFISALLHSAVRNLGTRCCFHLHVMNPPADVTARLAHFEALLGHPGISLSTEQVAPLGDPRTCYACARFRLLPHLLRRYRRPILMLDADLIVLRPLTGLLDSAAGHDGALVMSETAAFEPWNWLWADVVLAQPTDGAEAFFTLVARYIEYFLKQGEARWFLDQIALAACWLATRPRLLRLPRDVHRLELSFIDGVDVAPPESVLFWSAHASTVDTALTVDMPRYRDYLLPWPPSEGAF